MKQYWEIPGPSKAPKEHCIAFRKLDGSNIRYEYSKKRGWYKFGARHRMIDKSDEQFGDAISLFLNRYGDSIPKIIKDDKKYRGVTNFVAYCEYFGPSSFAGWHKEDEEKEVILFDIWIHKKGFVLPRDFVNDFGSLKTPDVIYEGNFNTQFVEDVKNGKYLVGEGVVAKGVIKGIKNTPNGIWMAKVKTKAWIEELKRRYKDSIEFRKALEDNLKEQGL